MQDIKIYVTLKELKEFLEQEKIRLNENSYLKSEKSFESYAYGRMFRSTYEKDKDDISHGIADLMCWWTNAPLKRAKHRCTDLKYRLKHNGQDPNDFIYTRELRAGDNNYHPTDCVDSEGAIRLYNYLYYGINGPHCSMNLDNGVVHIKKNIKDLHPTLYVDLEEKPVQSIESVKSVNDLFERVFKDICA